MLFIQTEAVKLTPPRELWEDVKGRKEYSFYKPLLPRLRAVVPPFVAYIIAQTQTEVFVVTDNYVYTQIILMKLSSGELANSSNKSALLSVYSMQFEL